MESLLERLQKETPSQQRERSVEALEFFRQRVRNIKVSSEAFYRRELGTLNKAKRFLEGRMYTFFYDPKTKEKLPYYDRFPLVLILDINQDGFTGLNLHYLPPRYRVRLLSKLYDFIVLDDDIDDDSMRTKIKMTYSLLQGVSQLKFFKPCYKRYLTTHIEGKALEIIPDYWDIISMLPVGQFEKASKREVYQDSIRSFN
jgi:hypothetical protein